MRTWIRRFFYSMAVLDFLMSIYFVYTHNYGEAGYWLACAVISFLLGYLVFSDHSVASRKQGDS